ncbi:hypothetical protein GCM10010211_13820 [Streptomyces albospinus]|uniref:Uncharacterized protein n=1 Tax=Streptomyces albospinus TaxID=285515 RepID=A0ABQ2UTE7_9ACTN|nr:hypothetical protein GCM10010211_13820 [Streptomyces albospinus]
MPATAAAPASAAPTTALRDKGEDTRAEGAAAAGEEAKRDEGPEDVMSLVMTVTVPVLRHADVRDLPDPSRMRP